MKQFELYAIITQPIAFMSIAASQVPWQASQRLSIARYATGTATEIQTQRDSNPVLTSASQQIAGM